MSKSATVQVMQLWWSIMVLRHRLMAEAELRKYQSRRTCQRMNMVRSFKIKQIILLSYVNKSHSLGIQHTKIAK